MNSKYNTRGRTVRKRIISLLLSVVLALSLLTGCYSSDTISGDEKIVLDYWTLFGGGDAEFMEEIVSDFNKSHPNIKVNYIQFAFDEYYTKLVTGISAGRAPDIAVSHMSRLPQLVKLGIVSSLDTMAQEIDIDWESYNQNILGETVYEGEHYAVPIDTHPIVMYYNKAHLEKAGLLNEQGKPIMEESPEGFIKFLTTLKQEVPEVAPFSFPTGGIDAYRLWWSLYVQMGEEGLLSDDLKSVDLDMDKAVKAANFMKSLYYEHEVIPQHLEDFYGTFQSGQAASFISGVWTTGIWEGTEGLDFGVVPIPTIYEEDGVFGSSHTLVLPRNEEPNEERRKAALTFANYVAEKGEIWAKAGHIPAHTETFEEEAYQELQHRSDYKEVADYVVYPKRSVNYASIERIIVQNLDAILNGSVPAERAFKQAGKQIQEVLDDSLLTGQ